MVDPPSTALGERPCPCSQGGLWWTPVHGAGQRPCPCPEGGLWWTPHHASLTVPQDPAGTGSAHLNLGPLLACTQLFVKNLMLICSVQAVLCHGASLVNWSILAI